VIQAVRGYVAQTQKCEPEEISTQLRARKFLAVTNHSVALYYLHEHS
jgi:hypothetical protein